MWVFQVARDALAKYTLVAWVLLGLIVAYSYEHGIRNLVLDLAALIVHRDVSFFTALTVISTTVIVAWMIASVLAVNYAAEKETMEMVKAFEQDALNVNEPATVYAGRRTRRAPLLFSIVAELKTIIPGREADEVTKLVVAAEAKRIVDRLKKTTHKDLRLQHMLQLHNAARALFFVPTEDDELTEQIINSYTARFRRKRIRGDAPDFQEVLIRAWLSTQQYLMSYDWRRVGTTVLTRCSSQFQRVTASGPLSSGTGANHNETSRDTSERQPLLSTRSTDRV